MIELSQAPAVFRLLTEARRMGQAPGKEPNQLYCNRALEGEERRPSLEARGLDTNPGPELSGPLPRCEQALLAAGGLTAPMLEAHLGGAVGAAVWPLPSAAEGWSTDSQAPPETALPSSRNSGQVFIFLLGYRHPRNQSHKGAPQQKNPYIFNEF